MEIINIETELSKVNLTDQAIDKMKDQFMALKVVDQTDQVGFEAVSTARKEAKKFRVALEKFLKQLREPALAFQKMVIAREKELSARIEEIEAYLTSQEEIFSPKEVVVKKPLTDEEKIASYARQIFAIKQPELETEAGIASMDKISRGLDELFKAYFKE